jgi:anti-sigma regulatory factor (Ser/Thr protein kinase)
MIGLPRPLVGGIVCLLFVAVGAVAIKRRDRPGALPFALLSLLFGLYALSATALTAWRAAVVVRVGLLESLTVAWLLFASAYTGRGPTLSHLPLAGLAGFVLVSVVGIVIAPVVPPAIGPLLYTTNFVVQSVTLALGGYGLFVAGRSAFVYDDLPTGGTAVVTVAGGGFVCLTVLSVVTNVTGRRVAADASLAILGLVAVGSLVTVRRFRPFAASASAGHLAREQILDEMDAAVVILDRAERVLDCNAAFEVTFGVDRRETIGGRLAGVVDSLSAGEQVPVETTDGRRVCDVERTVLTTADDVPVGEAYLVRDVTERRTREQRLDVLNRVLRHNLRNDLDAMYAFAETLETEPHAVEAADMGRRIRDVATNLADIGATVERGERLLDRDRPADEPVDVGMLARDVLHRVTEQYPGTGRVTAAGTPTIRTDPSLVEAVLREVIENGLEHGPGEDAHVVVDVVASPGGVEVTVRDNGPGIPDRERAVLLDGEESPLRHGTGVGLWLVNWGLSSLGGDLTIREDDSDGSVVTLTLPDEGAGA